MIFVRKPNPKDIVQSIIGKFFGWWVFNGEQGVIVFAAAMRANSTFGVWRAPCMVPLVLASFLRKVVRKFFMCIYFWLAATTIFHPSLITPKDPVF